jgi:hypothetical protein
MAVKAKKAAGPGDRAPVQPAHVQPGSSVAVLRGRSLKEAVDSLRYDCLFLGHFDATDRCVGFTTPPDMRPWAQRVGFCISVDEMEERYERSKSWRSELVLDFRSAMQAVADAERDGLPLNPTNVGRMLREAGLPAADYLAALVAAENERQAQQGAGRGRPKRGSLADAFASYGGGGFAQLTPWIIPRWRHVWRAECLFQVSRRGLGAGAAHAKIAGWHHVSPGTVANNVGALSH